MNDLFGATGFDRDVPRPLADILRPERLSDFVGQPHLVGPDGAISCSISNKALRSMIFWGPAGTGKTTLARLLANETSLHFEQISAIFSGMQELRKLFDAACTRRTMGRGTLLFVDEIHRFNRAQQDAFLPHMEDGAITLVGATTENPSFELNDALLSRSRLLIFYRLNDLALEALLQRAEKKIGRILPLDDDARLALITMADGDGRVLLGLVEDVFTAVPEQEKQLLSRKKLIGIVQRRAPVFDKSGDGHYNLISALHKSVRGSDPDAALYWLARLLVSGEDPLFIIRRVVRMAVEDIGLSDPQALSQALAAKDAYEFLGAPEGELAIAQAVIYCATAPKSNAVYMAYKAVMCLARESGSVSPPLHILNAPTDLMKSEGYGSGYIYDHDTPDGFSGQNYFPDGWERPTFYKTVERGFEREIGKRLVYWKKLREQRSS